MEQKMYYQNSKAFRHFITWRQRYRLGKYLYSIYSIVLIVIIIINYTSASITSEKLHLNNYNSGNGNSNENDDGGGNANANNNININNVNNLNNGISNGNEHNMRHSHKYTQTIDSLLNSLKNSKNMIYNLDRETPRVPRMPYDTYELAESVCPTCYLERNSDEIRLEAIKLQILSKLGLREKPTITLPVPRDVIIETLSRAAGGEYGVGTGVDGGGSGSLLQGEGSGGVRGDEAGVDRAVAGEDGLGQREKESDVDEGPMESEPDDFYGRTREIITFAEPGQLLNGQTLLEFSQSSESDPGVFVSQLRVKSALLWVRVALNRSAAANYHPIIGNKNMTLWVFKFRRSVANTSFLSGKDFDDHTELVGSLSVSLSNLGWQKIDMTGAVREWYKEGNSRKDKLRLLVDCSGCKDVVQVLIFQRNRGYRMGHPGPGRKARSLGGDGGPRRDRDRDRGGPGPGNRLKFDVKFNEEAARGDYAAVKNVSSHQSEKLDPNRPFLVVHTEPVVMKRSRRRALDCSGAVRGQCCKQNFFVSFKDLKWDDWIIAPKGYHANYCRGDCGGMHRTPDTFLNYHTHVIEEYRKMDRLSGIQPCCAPVKFSSMSLIYFGPDNNIIKRDLPKMVVEQCGCP